MSKKYPYGIRVRVVGSDELGYQAQISTGYTLLNRLMGTVYWSCIRHKFSAYFSTFEEAKAAAIGRYNYEVEIARQKKARKEIWGHP